MSPQRAHKIRSACARWGYSALFASVANGALLAYYLSRPQGSLFTVFSGGLSVLFCFLASFTLAYCRNSVPNGYLNLTDARFARRFPWILWAFSIPLTGVSLMVLWVSSGPRFGSGWGLALYVLTLVFPLLLTTVIAVRCLTLFQAPFYHGPVPPQHGPVPPRV
ncbi:MAG: hypothetical protein ABIQ18_14665 [Umezawaea sp.]